MSKEIERGIMSRVGKPVTFRYRKARLRGVLKSCEVCPASRRRDDSSVADGVQGQYIPVVDVIEFDGRPERVIRTGYFYVRPNGGRHWASRSTSAHPWTQWRDSIVPAVQRAIETEARREEG